MLQEETTRERILDASLNLFYQHGFHAVGLDRILAEVGVTKTTFYNHFESKDELILEVIRRRDAWWRKTFQEEIEKRGGDDPVAQLRSVFDVLREWFSWVDFNGCLFINAASEFPSKHEPAHQAAFQNVAAIREILVELAQRAGLAEPAEFARMYNLLIEGAIVTEVIDRNCDAADTAATVGEVLIGRHLELARGQV